MIIQNRKVSSSAAWFVSLLVAWMAMRSCPATAVGMWVPLTNGAPYTVSLMLLLSDGSVMCQQTTNNGGPNASNWCRLRPDQYGSYANGTWTTDITNMNYTRGLFASAVLPNGKVFVAGGEYPSGAQTANAEIYDPVANQWTVVNPPTNLFDPTQPSLPWPGSTQAFEDMISVVISNGSVLMAPVNPRNFGGTLLYNATSGWSDGPVLTDNVKDQAECSWAKLPDGSILTIDPGNPSPQTSERYIPSLNQWIPDSLVPVVIFNGIEIGPATVLPNGQALFLGGANTNLLYTPSGNTSPGTWTVAPATPQGLWDGDAPVAMMVNGKALCEFYSPTNGIYHFFYEYDYTAGTNAFTPVPPPTGGGSNSPLVVPGETVLFMLDLPDGTVLFSDNTTQLYVYQPDGSLLPAGKPTITSITPNADGSFHLVGAGLNGISEGATYGDDGQMASDYPLVRMTNSVSNFVFYARTYDWSSTSIQTGNTPESTEFTVPTNLPPGSNSLVVVANGNASAPFTFYGPVWVDFNYTGTQYGTYQNPFETLAQGTNAVVSGQTIFIKASVQPSTSPETMTISKPMTIISVGGPSIIGN